MSEFLQHGHPDADQLSAFMEHALPADAREQTMAHLAVCPECREIVRLAVEAEEELPVVAPAKPSRSWWTGWRFPVWQLAVPVAALVAVALVTLHFRRAAQPEENAGVTPPVLVQPSAPPPTTTSVPAPAARVRESGPGARSSVRARILAPPATPKPVITDSEVASLPLRGRDTGMLSPRSAVRAEGTPAPRQLNAPPAVMGAMAAAAAPGGVAGGYGSAPLPAPPVAHGDAMGSGTGAAVVKQQPAAQSRSTTAEVSSAAPELQTQSAELDMTVEAAALDHVAAQPSLPSHLPAISRAVNGSAVVALDAARNVFVSKDGGAHWSAVAGPWTGRPARVQRVGAVMNVGGGFAVGIAAAPMAGVGSSLTGVVADATGAAIPGASVTVTGSVTRSAKANEAGRYMIAGLPPGPYQLRVSEAGFEAYATTVTVGASTRINEDVKLQPGSTSESVEVTSDAASVEAAAPGAERRVKKEPVFELETESGERWTSVDGRKWSKK